MKSAITLLALAAILSITSCKKSSNSPSTGNEMQLQASVTQNAADEYNVQTDETSISSDANAAVATNPSFVVSGSKADSSTIAGAIVDRTLITALSKKIKIIYRGLAVLGVVRSGEVVIELVSGDSWINKNAVLKLTFNDVKITYLGRSLVYNGTCYITNVSGGLPFISTTVVHSMRVNATVRFDDNTTLTWWAARKNSYFQNDLSFKSEGDTLVNGESCTMGGVNRYNANFLVKAPQAIVSNATCGFDKPVAGSRVFVSDNRNTTITFGVKANGSPVNSGDCAYGYKIEWTMWNGHTATLIISYAP
jgi:hypothetical protein